MSLYFQPEPVLVLTPGGTYTLLVKTLVPSSCYQSGQIRHGLPSGQVGIPELDYYTWDIEHTQGICAQYVHYIHQQQTGIKLGAGKEGIAVLTVVDGKVAGGAVVRPFFAADQRTSATGGTPGLHVVPGTISAVAFGGIFEKPKLRVTALVQTPTPGYSARFVEQTPQGINPAILLLKLEADPPSGPVIQIPSFALATYEGPYRSQIKQVTVLNGPEHFTVPVIVLFAGGGAKPEFLAGGVIIGS